MLKSRRKNNLWLMGAFMALLGAAVVTGCGGNTETETATETHKEGDGHDHKEGDGHEHKEGEKH